MQDKTLIIKVTKATMGKTEVIISKHLIMKFLFV